MQLIAFSYSQATITTNYAATGTTVPKHGVLQTDTRETVACHARARHHNLLDHSYQKYSYASKPRL